MEEFDQLFDDELFNIDEVEDKTLKLKEGERRMVSVLFADIKGFTSMSETLDHEEVQSIIDKLMKIFSHSVEVYGGYVDKYTGDQIMALFGAKHASEVDTQRAVNSGLDMLSKLDKFNVILKNSSKYSKLNINLSIRIGINTGMVTTGAIGKEREGDYTVYGDAVNLAARMESNAPVNAIMIPEETKVLIEDDFAFNDEGEIQVKGKSDPISVFTILSRKDIEVVHDTPFLGRDEELMTLNSVYNKSSKDLLSDNSDKINFVGIEAEAGTGKSRLIYEFLKDNSEVQPEEHYSLGFASNISSKPYYIFFTLIKDIFKISEMDSISTTKQKLESGYALLYNVYNEILLKDSLPFVGFLLGIKYDDERLKDRNEFKNHMHISVKTVLEATSRISNTKNKPYLFILDDLHWIDKMSLDMLYYILATINISSKRNQESLSCFTILSTYRSEFKLSKELESAVHFTHINLKPLKREISRELIDKLMINIDVEEDKKIELLDKSKGNPFFIEEWVSLLKESHTYTEPLDESRGIHNIYKIPNSLNSLILARVDSLESNLKMLLQKATIIGEDFFLQILSKLETKLGISDGIQIPVDKLEKENFIKHFINQLDHYKFKHILTRDVAYSTILKSNKKILHSAVAEIIEENFQDKIDMFYFDLAIHYDISEDHDKAMKFLSLAGEKNICISDFIHAKQCYDRILSIINENKPYSEYIKKTNESILVDSEQYIIDMYIDAKMNLGKILLNTGKWNEGVEILKSTLPHLKNIRKTTQFSIYFTLGKIFNLKRDQVTSKKYFITCLEMSKDMKDKLSYAYTLGELSDLEFDIGNVDNALKGFKKQLELAEILKEDRLFQVSYLNLGMYYFQNGELDTSMRFYKKLYENATRLDSKQQILQALGNISLIHNIRGEYDKSLDYFKDVIAISEDIHDLRNQAMTYGNQGIIYKNLKKYDVSLDNYKRQLKISIEIGDKYMESNSLDGIGLIYQKMYKFEDAIKSFDKSLSLNKSIKNNNGISNVLINLSSTYIMMGNIDNATSNLNKALETVKSIKNKRSEHLIYINLARIDYLKNNFLSSIKIIENSIAYFYKMKDYTYFLESITILANCYKSINEYSKLEDLIGSYKLDTNAYKEFSDIENEFIVIKKSNIVSTHITSILNDDNTSKSKKAFINFILSQILNKDEYKEASRNSYLDLYKSTKIFQYKYYADKIK